MAKDDETKVFTADEGRIEFAVVGRYSNMATETKVNEREYFTPTGRLAVRLVEHFGVVAATPDGEDSSGRQKGALLPPEEVVSRAMDIAERTIGELRSRGHFVMLPSLETVLE